MEIREIQKAFMADAAALGDYQSMTKTELANGYCDAEEAGDQLLRSHYWSALMLRYWYKIFEWARTSQSCRLPLEDFIHWLNDSLCDAFYYRSWRWEYEAVVRDGKFIEWKLDEQGNRIPNEHYWKVDPNAPDKSINYFCSARRAKEYQALNKQKRKLNVMTYSLDAAVDDTGDYALSDAGAYTEPEHNLLISSIVHKFLEQDRLIEALIVDGIANYDSFKETKTSHTQINVEEVIDEDTGLPKVDEEGNVVTVETKEKVYDYSSVFDKRKLVKHLNNINQNFMRTYFVDEYEISVDLADEIYKKLKSMNNTKLYNYIEKTLVNLRTEMVGD